jgi:hypothetical protein
MHIGGEGTEAQLASGVRAVLEAVKKIRANAPEPAKSSGHPPVAADNSISAKGLDAIFSATGTAKDGTYKLVVGREVAMPCDCTAGKEMGVQTWAGFRGSDARAAVDGDFACAYGELQPVLKALRAGGIDVVAIHNHMEAEAPRLMFVHFQATGPAEALAKALRSALDAQRTAHTAPAAHQHEHHQ